MSHGGAPHHGGGVHAAAAEWGIAVADWLDLSTGINPHGYPVPPLPAEVWQRLPDVDDGLEQRLAEPLVIPAGARLLPIAGSQAAIQQLPELRRQQSGPARVAVPQPGYQEHGHCWQQAGHHVEALTVDQVEQRLPSLDVLVWINPNNPSGEIVASDTLLRWHQSLAARGGWLIVDEAFIDASPARSLLPHSHRAGLWVLRSLGKFYGLAGVRAGCLVGESAQVRALQARLGPWALSHPARHIMALALTDTDWQQTARQQLAESWQRLAQLLAEYGLAAQGLCSLFAYCPTPVAAQWYQALARQGVLVRQFSTPSALRIGLPGSPAQWQRLQQALAQAIVASNGSLG